MKRTTSGFDLIVFGAMLILIFIGIAVIYSAGYSNVKNNLYIKQFIWFVIGSIFFCIAVGINYDNFTHYAIYIYSILCFLLLLTLIFGRVVHTTRGWISFGIINFQTAEFMKLGVIFVLARYLNFYAYQINSFKDLLVPFLIVIFPLGLILLQPDLGTAIVLLPILYGMLYVAGTRSFHLLGLLFIGLFAIAIPLLISYYKLVSYSSSKFIEFISSKNTFLIVCLILFFIIILLSIIYNFKPNKNYITTLQIIVFILAGLFLSIIMQNFLKPYQQKRLLVFIDPNIDKYGAGYNIKQSIISIGSGGLFGKGFLKGTQSHLGFLPTQATDFIFSVIGEEFGLLGTSFVLLLIFIIIYQGVKIIHNAKNMFGSLLAGGIVSMFIFHYLINIGMAIGIMPITGIPLPLLSYGGSSLVVSMFSIGVLINIKYRRFIY